MKVRCIGKVMDKNNRVIGYTLLDQSGNKLTIKSDALKNAIRNNKVEVINLALTSDNRLIDNKEKSDPDKIRTILNRATSLGMNVKQFKTGCKHECYILSKDGKHILIIPDDVTKFYDVGIHEYMQNLTGSLKVIGGKNLIDASYMFAGCKVQSLDLRSFDTRNVTDMSSMFDMCEVRSINLSSLDTRNVTDMSFMFNKCKVQSLDLRSFDTSKVIDMQQMFKECEAHSINLSSFDTRSVAAMGGMFGWCKAQSLDLSSFDTSNVTDMRAMFYNCKVQSLDLSSFDTSKVTDMINMFNGCKTQSINLSSFDTSNVINMSWMFKDCKAQSINLSSFDMNNVKDMQDMFYAIGIGIGELILNTSAYSRVKSLLKNMEGNVTVS